MAQHTDRQTAPDDQILRTTGVIFLVCLLLHGADHARRGFGAVTPEVFWTGNVQTALALVAVALVFMRHRWAPLAAMAIGFPSAIGFTAAHLLPHWSSFSDAFPGGHVDGWSWAAAFLEIAADLAFGFAGWCVLRRRGWASAGAARESERTRVSQRVA